jgi:hypothetical protein
VSPAIIKQHGKKGRQPKDFGDSIGFLRFLQQLNLFLFTKLRWYPTGLVFDSPIEIQIRNYRRDQGTDGAATD